MTVQPRVALFVTCLVDLFRPSVGLAAVKLLEQAGCEVEVPEPQVCCGQPAFNNGDRHGTELLARQLIPALEPFDYVVIPSGSCAGMVAKHFMELFDNDAAWRQRATAIAAKTYELMAFLVDVRGLRSVATRLDAKVTYHDSCSGLRELAVKRQPRALLATVEGLELVEMAESEVCCGFGGTFCVKYPEISTRMVTSKVEHALATEAEILLAGDLGCLLNMAGRIQREARAIKVRHVAEVLAGQLDMPAIGEPG